MAGFNLKDPGFKLEPEVLKYNFPGGKIKDRISIQHMTTIGTKIRKLRELRNYTQNYMADQLGISQTAYSKMELDETEVSSERLQQIAKALNLPVQDILAFDEKLVFNFINSQIPNGANSYPTYNIYMSDNERKLYEDKIKLQEEMIEMLKKEVERLKGK